MLFNKILLYLAFAALIFFPACESKPYESTPLRCWINEERYKMRTGFSILKGKEQNLSIVSDSLNLDVILLPVAEGASKNLIIVVNPFSGVGTHSLKNGKLSGSLNYQNFIPSFDAEFTVVSVQDNGNGTSRLIGYFHMASANFRITNGRFDLNFRKR